MEDKKYWDMDEMMVDYAEMTSFDFSSDNFIAINAQKSEYSNQPYTFKYGSYDVLDMLKVMFTGSSPQKV